MLIGSGLRSQCARATLSSPFLAPRHEEALLTAQPVNGGRHPAVQRCMISIQCQDDPGDVSDVFAERLLSVEMNTRQDFIGVHLSGKLFCLDPVMHRILWCPPVPKCS